MLYGSRGRQQAARQAGVPLELGAQGRGTCGLFDQQVGERLVHVIAAERSVAGGGHHSEDAVVQIEDRDIKGPAAQIVDREPAFLLAGPGHRPARPLSAR